MYCDLHTHSIYSDGTCTPAEILQAAKAQDLIVALTDHNSVSGLPEFMAAARELGVTAVPGIEFTTEDQGLEIHMVALFVRPESYDAIRAYVEGFDRLKAESNRALVERLNAAGYYISYEEIVAQTPDGRVNRANIGAELVKKGYVTTVKEAFSQLLREECGYYVPAPRADTLDTITFIRSIGAVPVLGHPLLTMDEARLRQLLPRAKERGLVAMETQYTSYDPETLALAGEIAREFGLLESGGSDFHGENKPGNPLGSGRNGLQIPEDVYRALAQWAQENRQ